MRLARFKNLFVLLGLYLLSLIGLLTLQKYPLPISCPFKLITGLPCPGCGGMRATLLLLHGDIIDALYMNPLSCIVVVFLALLPFLMLWDIVKERKVVDKLLHEQWPMRIWVPIFALICANWIWNIYKGY